MKNLIISILLFQPFYNMDGWSITGTWKTITYLVICFLASVAITEIESKLKERI